MDCVESRSLAGALPSGKGSAVDAGMVPSRPSFGAFGGGKAAGGNGSADDVDAATEGGVGICAAEVFASVGMDAGEA